MKLLIITAIAEFEKEVKQLLKQAEVITYSYKHVTGYRDSTLDAVESNWFGVEMNESDAILFYAFVSKENVDTVFELTEQKNAEHTSKSRIHVASINIEKSN
jgi:nitrogen regulatory protein PII